MRLQRWRVNVLVLTLALSAHGLGGCAGPHSDGTREVASSPAIGPRARAAAPIEAALAPRTCSFGDASACRGACDRGDAPSCNNLGAMFEVGEGVAVDRGRARALYVSACSGQAREACANLSRLAAEDTAAATRETNREPPPPDPSPMATEVAAPLPASPPPEPPSACRGDADCKSKCARGDEDACRELPGIHIAGNVRVFGNVTMFGNVYLYGSHAPRR